MSNYDRNAAAPGTIADGATTVDAGLRAYMLRVYNYMATGVGLTGLVAMLTYQFTGPELLQSPLMWVFMLAPLGLVFFISAPYQHPVGGNCATVILHLCGLGRIVAFDNLPRLYRLLDHAGVLHLSRDLRCTQSLGLYHPARPVGIRHLPGYGRDRHCYRERGQPVPEVDADSTGSFPSSASASSQASLPTTLSESRECTTATMTPLLRAARPCWVRCRYTSTSSTYS